MRQGHLLFSAVQFIFVVALFLLGGLFIGLQYAPCLRASLAAFITDHASALSLLGWAIVGCSLLLCAGFYAMYRGAYYRVQMNHGEAIVESKIIEEFVQEYWKSRFPDKELKTEIVLRGKEKIEVLAEIPEMELESQAVLLSEVELELGALLERHLGYRRNWMMTIIPKYTGGG